MRMGTRFARKLLVLVGLCLAVPAFAQTAPSQAAQLPTNRPAVQMPAPTPNDTLKSVEVMADRHVRFRLWAPNAAEVKLHAEGPEATPGITPQEANKYQAGVPMAKGDQGIWEATIGPIEPGIYRYTFTVDGLTLQACTKFRARSSRSTRPEYPTAQLRLSITIRRQLGVSAACTSIRRLAMKTELPDCRCFICFTVEATPMIPGVPWDGREPSLTI